MNVKKTGASYVKPFLIGSALLVVLVLHFAVSQFIAFESEKDSSVAESIDKRPAVIEPEKNEKRTEIAASAGAPNRVSKIDSPEPKIEAKRTIEKETTSTKKAARPSRVQRLRRAEKILTGI